MDEDMPPHGGSAVDALAALLGTVVAIRAGGVSGGQALAPLGRRGALTIPLVTPVDPGPTRARIELIAGLVHVVIPAGGQGIDILVPEEEISRNAGTITIDGRWLDRVRIVGATIRVAPLAAAEAPDWSDLLTHQAVRRYESAHRYSLALERAIDRCIRENDMDALSRHLATEPLDRSAGRLANGNALRGLQNLVISLLTVATRSAVDAGTSVPMAFGISDHFIQEIEQVKESGALLPLLLRAITALAESVAVSRQLGRSTLVRAAEEWIFVHLDGNLRPSAIALALSVSTDYLAAQFRRETGMSIDTYVQRRKVEQARTMLTHTTLPVPEICAQLNFYDQSHFSRVFRRHTAETPRQYRLRTRPRSAPGERAGT
ncbi:helix-turn-helix domain-containing protein [Streptomyces caniscabiei]|uniref:helix-turn-helix domain-containing protein n=1 Tax=Streptomyces caniscabiei TaxID=2746961 RepID=UPI000A3794E5|nr:helix-turn-helix domain-containing protein [Streptomyces caniscabiei]